MKGSALMSDKKLDLILNEIHKLREDNNRRFDRNEEMISTLIQIVGTTNSKVEELQADMKDLQADMKIVQADMKIVQADISTLKENQLTIMQMQQDQQKILERLSVRSISHEADIAELRRIK
jgi:peptidoglycan hydrolase CwlO-like protein